jgi:hypothetical protein
MKISGRKIRSLEDVDGKQLENTFDVSGSFPQTSLLAREFTLRQWKFLAFPLYFTSHIPTLPEDGVNRSTSRNAFRRRKTWENREGIGNWAMEVWDLGSGFFAYLYQVDHW